MQKTKHYVVWRGRQTGIFESWDACKAQVHQYPQASFKGFHNRQIAEKAWEMGKQFNVRAFAAALLMKDVAPGICVDAACHSFTGDVEFRGVTFPEGQEIFSYGPYEKGSVNLGEFMAIVKALQYCADHSLTLPIYSDSTIALRWVEEKNIRTGVLREPDNEPLFDLIDDALKWLKNNFFTNQLLKWHTAAWGENPADYGRK